MKLWDKGYKIDAFIEQFTVGNDRELDVQLAKYDVKGSVAHAKMLQKIGILSEQELDALLGALNEISNCISEGCFVIEHEFEDVHSKIEFLLTQKIGDTGKKIHTARSRNDQVLVDLHLYAKDQINEIKEAVKALFDTLMVQSEKYKDALIPGYTHLQLAMPSSFGLWFSAYAETLIDDVIMLNAAFKIADQNPLGSAAGYGSSFPIDREMTTELLGFDTLKYNSIAAQMSRGKMEKTMAFALASVSSTLAKLSMDISIYMNQNFGFLTFPKNLTTGSSIMPHKQNPDVFEIIRAKSNQIQNLPNEIALIVNNLPSGYHRDFQMLKSSFMEAVELVKENLDMTNYMLQQVIINQEVLNNPNYDFLYSVEEVNKLVATGVSFRDAYKQIGGDIESGNFNPEKKINHTHLGSIGNLGLDKIQKKFDQHYC